PPRVADHPLRRVRRCAERLAIDASSEIVRRAASAEDVVCLQADGLDAGGLFWNVTATGPLGADRSAAVAVPASHGERWLAVTASPRCGLAERGDPVGRRPTR